MNMINISVAGGVPSPVEGACGALTIGNVGDNGATGVLLDFSAWAEEYGAGAVTLGVRRKGDAAWYPVALTVTGAAAVWIVSNIDTAVYGIGEARFAYTVGEVEKRSAVFRFFVDRGLGAPEGTPPAPYEDWVERLEDLGAETLQNAQDAAESASEAHGYAEDAQAAKEAAEAAAESAESSQEDAEAWAVGERGGVPVEEGDPTYQNNAKYWAEQAQTDAPVTSVNGKTGAVELNLDDIPDGETYRRATGEQLQQIDQNAEDLNAIEELIPNQASAQNQLADKAFVNSSIQTSSAHFRGNWQTWADVPTDAALYPVDDDGNTTPTSNDYMVLQDAAGYPVGAGDDPLEGTWRFKYSGVWATQGRAGWQPEYQVNETPLTAAQLAALNSGATAELVAQITVNETDIQGKQDKITASGMLKGDGAGNVSAAVAGSDYATPEQVNAKYTKPVLGIPKTDLASDVQTSLTKADSALQEVPNTYRTAAEQDVIDEEQNEAINDFYEATTDSGSIVTFDAPADGLPIHKLTMQIEPVQAGSGDPSPTNVRPISGWTGCSITRCGKNLYNITSPLRIARSLSDITYFKDTYNDGVLTFGAVAGSTAGAPIPVKGKPNTKYSVHIKLITGDGIGGNNFVLSYTEYSETTQLGTNGTYITVPAIDASHSGIIEYDFTTRQDSKWLGINAGSSQSRVFSAAEIQVEIGSATAYEPYKGNSYDIDFPSEAGTVYGGTLTINDDGTGELIVDRAMVDAGNYNFTKWAFNNGVVTWAMNAPGAINGTPLLSSKYRQTNSSVAGMENNTCWNKGHYWQLNSIFFRNTDFDELSSQEVKAAMAGTQVCYYLKDPITYQLTQQQVIDTLYGTNNIWADCGDVEVEHGAWLVGLKGAINRTTNELYALRASIAPVEDGTTASQSYAAGEFFFRNGQFCAALVQIASGAAFTLGTNYQVTTVAAALIALQS